MPTDPDTFGPWFYQQTFDPDYGTDTRKIAHEVHDAHGETVVVCADERTARLIAAAPWMFESLEELLALLPEQSWPAIYRARHAIGIAKGEAA